MLSFFGICGVSPVLEFDAKLQEPARASNPVGILICDRHGRVETCNSTAREMFGESCAKGTSLTELCPQLVKDKTGRFLPAPGRFDFQIRSKDGHLQKFIAQVEINREDSGETSEIILTFVKVEKKVEVHQESGDQLSQCETKLEETKTELIKAREDAARAIATKTEFLSNMSHELRTPMNAVIGMSEILWETNLTDEQRKFLTILMKGGRTLVGIIDDILNFTRLESGSLPLNLEEFNLREMMEKVVELIRPLACEKNLELRFEKIKDQRVLGDPKRLEQVVINLLGNAVKFTKSGHVSIGAYRKEGSVSNEVQFFVRDTGIGIPPEKLNALFNRFSQLDMSITKTYGGTGLGLAISKQLVELMGGTIWVESRQGHGTTFHFTAKLPLSQGVPEKRVREQALESGKIPIPIEKLRGMRILVVEDSKDNAFLISLYLRNMGCEIDFAEDGRQAVEKFKRSTYDLILMDMQMPEMDGYSATRWIRILEMRGSTRVPIIALTAFTMSEEVQKSYDVGCDDHLNKPVTKSSLLSSIVNHLHSETHPSH